MELLTDGFERVKYGHGQAFAIIGEAGVGKTRLLYELRKSVSNENVTFRQGKCLSYSQGVAYHPIIDVLKANFDIRETDDDFNITDKVKHGLNLIGVDESSTLPSLLELFSVKDNEINQINFSREARKERIIEASIRVSLKGAEIRPIILVFEDLHWIDHSSEDVLKRLLDSISGSSIMLIFTFRPEFLQTWGSKSYHNQINLNRLSNRETLNMITSILDAKGLDSDLENLILEKTEGIPFFL